VLALGDSVGMCVDRGRQVVPVGRREWGTARTGRNGGQCRTHTSSLWRSHCPCCLWLLPHCICYR